MRNGIRRTAVIFNEADILRIAKLYKRGIVVPEIAEEYGVSQTRIYIIIGRLREQGANLPWRHKPRRDDTTYKRVAAKLKS